MQWRVISSPSGIARDLDFESFIRQHDPKVVVYDIAPPYEANFKLFQHLRAMPTVAGRQFVVTTTNKAQVEKLVGRDYRVYEIIGKPTDLDQIVRAVKEASRARPTR